MSDYSSLVFKKEFDTSSFSNSDSDLDKTDVGLDNPRLLNALRECTSRQSIDDVFIKYEVFDLQCRVQILREAMGCLVMLNASIENPRIKREKFTAEQRLEMMYEAEKTSFLDDLGFS